MHANWLTRITNLFNITVRSSSGDEIALDIPVLHARHIRDASTSSISISNDQIRKRLVSRPQLSGCEAPFSVFVDSLCSGRTPQTFILQCTIPAEQSPTRTFLRKTCLPYEICVTKVVGNRQQAECISQVDFRLIQKVRTGDVTPSYYASHILTLPPSRLLDHTGLVATLVAQNDITKTVVAARILLQAVGAASKVEPVNGLSLYADSNDCLWCESLLMVV